MAKDPRFKRQERQAVRGPAQEGHEQAACGLDRQLAQCFEQGRKEKRERQWRLEVTEARRRPRGRQEVELARDNSAVRPPPEGRAAGPLTVDGQGWIDFVDFEVITTPIGNGDALSVAVYGELDLASCERLKPATDEAVFARRALILDLSSCSFIDSSGLRLLVQIARDLTGEGDDRAVPMGVVAGEDSPVRKMLALTAIDLRIPVFETAAEANKWLSGKPKPNGELKPSSMDSS